MLVRSQSVGGLEMVLNRARIQVEQLSGMSVPKGRVQGRADGALASIHGGEVAGVCALAWLVALSVYDIRDRQLPNWLTLPGAAVMVAVAACTEDARSALMGAAAVFGVYLMARLLSTAAIGAGDVKLAVGVGALTGAGVDVWPLAALGAPMLTAVGAVIAVVRSVETTVPHGPSMCIATAAAVMLAVG